MNRQITEWFMKMGWPLIKFFLYNYGEEIVMYIFEKLRKIITDRKHENIAEAMRKAESAEAAAETVNNPEDKLKYYELAKAYRDEADRQREFLRQFTEELENSTLEITKSVQDKINKIEIHDIFEIEEKTGFIKVIDDNKEIKVKKKKGKKSMFKWKKR